MLMTLMLLLVYDDVDVDVKEIRAQTIIIVSMPVLNIQFLITIL